MTRKMWIFGRNAEPYEYMKWEIMGVFTSEQKAVDATVHSDRDWIAPLRMDEKLPDGPFVLPGSYYPCNPDSKPYCGGIS